MEQQTKKQQQVAGLIQKELSTILLQEGTYIYGDALVTITRVRMSSDMGIAYVYASVYNSLYKQEVIKMMWENLSRLRGELGKAISSQVRRIPMLKFFIDDTLDVAEHLDNLFANLNKSNSNRSMREVKDAQVQPETNPNE
jgi:ribosome-binding factor A